MDYKQLAIAYFSGRISRQEADQLNHWVRANSAHADLYHQWEQEWGESLSAHSLTNASWQDFSKRIEHVQQPVLRNKSLLWTSVAACVIIVLVLSVMHWGSPTTPLVETPTTEMIAFEATTPATCYLPDSTKVILSANSSLTYAPDFGNNNRDVTLVGEGYFEVTHSNDLPFVVTSNDFKVQVTGTHFTIANYDHLSASVILYEGSILATCRDSTYVLSPSQRLILAHQQVTLYDDICLSDVFTYLTRLYNVPIQYKADSTQTVHIVIKEGTPLEDVLLSLQDIYGIDVCY